MASRELWDDPFLHKSKTLVLMTFVQGTAAHRFNLGMPSEEAGAPEPSARASAPSDPSLGASLPSVQCSLVVYGSLQSCVSLFEEAPGCTTTESGRGLTSGRSFGFPPRRLGCDRSRWSCHSFDRVQLGTDRHSSSQLSSGFSVATYRNTRTRRLAMGRRECETPKSCTPPFCPVVFQL